MGISSCILGVVPCVIAAVWASMLRYTVLIVIWASCDFFNSLSI